MEKISKTFTRTIKTVTEVCAVPIDEDFVLVHTRTNGKADYVVMRTEEFAGVKRASQIKRSSIPVPHNKNEKAFTFLFSSEMVQAIKDGRHDWYNAPSPKIEFGDPAPSGCEVLLMSDNTFLYPNGKYVNQMVVDFYREEAYDLDGLTRDPEVVFLPERPWREPSIFYVPGNGYTARVGVRLTDEQYEVWVSRDWYGKKLYLDEIILGKYAKPEGDEDE